MTTRKNIEMPENNAAPPPEAVEAVVDFCRTMVDRLGLDLTVAGGEVEGGVVVDLGGPDRPLLLQNSAALLNSIEYLLNKAFRSGRQASILVDSQDYRKHREAELVLLARMASEKAIARGRPLKLQPMTPRERRIIHLALAGIEGVRSESDGEGEERSVTIYPEEV